MKNINMIGCVRGRIRFWRGQILGFAVVLIAYRPPVLCGEYFSCVVNLKTFGAIKGVVLETPNYEVNARVEVDLESGHWLIRERNNNQWFASCQGAMIVEKPHVLNATRSWYIVSTPVEGYPIDLDFDKRLIWFSYCGTRCIRDSEGRYMPLLYGDTRLEAFVHGCRIRTSWRSVSDRAPQEAEFYFDSALFIRNTMQLSSEPPGPLLSSRGEQFQHYLQSHRNNQLIASYKVESWQDFPRAGFPIKWEYRHYQRGQLSLLCVGNAGEARIQRGAISFPYISENADITDKRLRNVALGINSVQYRITNGIIPGIEDAQKHLIQYARKFKDIDRATLPSIFGKRHFLVAVMVGVSLAFLLAIFYIVKREQTTK